jgi:ABC-type dipeptide/oligopeptide/nickel transport system permease component
LILLIPVLIGVSLLAFFIMRSAGDPTFSYIQNPDKLTDVQYELIREKYHLNEPTYIQYFYWLDAVLHGDLGYTSADQHKPVTQTLTERFPATFELAILATLFSVVIGITVGTASAVRANSAFDQASRVTSLVAVSIPVFWLGIMLQMLFYSYLGWLPLNGRFELGVHDPTTLSVHTNFLLIDTLLSGDFSFFIDALKHIMLPAITLAFVSTALILRMMRASMLEVLGAEYVQTARSKGLSEKIVIKKHARRNALIPTTTVVGLSFGALLGGAVLTESVFDWQGLGAWSVDAALRLDSAGVMGFTLLTATIYVLANLMVDLTYAYLDPRVRLG